MPFDDGLGRELFVTYATPLETNSTWWTDSEGAIEGGRSRRGRLLAVSVLPYPAGNGRDMIPRVRNARPDWNYTAYEPIAGNFFPVTAAMTTQDASRGLALTVATDRSHGGSSLEDGSLCKRVTRGSPGRAE